jgi:hypothetical protein
MMIRSWNQKVADTLEWLSDYRTTICAGRRGCFDGDCYCHDGERYEVYALDYEDVIQLLMRLEVVTDGDE